jgi:2-dehydro-3-deoxygalactonokinase
MRVWLMAGDGTIVAERRSADGMASLSSPQAFADVLENHLAASGAPTDLPVVACGMVGSRQGWAEAGYLDCPAAPDDIIAAAIRVPGTARQVVILPGMAMRDSQHPDVMRGEETQILGLAATLGQRETQICMPGTHSKWVSMVQGRVASFRTVMTGEMHALLARQSILRHSLADGTVNANSPAFRDAARRVLDGDGGFSSLFAVRAGPLLGIHDADASASTLSAVLIASEIREMLAAGTNSGAPIILVGGSALGALYEAVFALADTPVHMVDADDACRDGLSRAAQHHFGVVITGDDR